MKYSIILPVKNGGEFVKDCVNSILSQSYTDFSLLILDNKSTDGTLEWLRSVQDNRVRIFPSDKPLTIEENWDRITTIPRNEFITLIGHDDLLHKDYLRTMDELIIKYPDAALFQTHFSYIDAKGEKIRDCRPMAVVESPEAFLGSFLTNNIDVMGTGFMMRSKDYDALGGIPQYPNLLLADFELFINLAKISYKVTSPKNCFSFRLHQSTTAVSPDTKFHEAFEKFIYFLDRLKKEKESFDDVIRKNGGHFLSFYCRGLSHRLLRTPKSKRNGLTVKKFVDKCKAYAIMLGIEESFKPDRIFSVKLAKVLDNNAFGRAIFLGFKKIFPKPVLK